MALESLKKKKDFAKVFRKGKAAKESFLFLKASPNNLTMARFGIIVSQKVSKKAVLRNKIRRRIREVLRMRQPEIKGGVDVVISALPGAQGKNFKEIDETIKNLFIKAKVIKR